MSKKLLSSLYLVASLALSMCVLGCGSDSSVRMRSNGKAVRKSLGGVELAFYMENSGSMDGYVCAGSTLRSDVYSYVSALSSHCSKTHLNYVNTKVIKIDAPLNRFFDQLTPSSFRKKGGDRSHSELSNMLKQVLGRMNDSVVSVFVSDCILDPKAGMPNLYFSQRQTSFREIFQNYLRKHHNFGVMVYQVNSSFDGKLYPSGKQPMVYRGERPYYIWVMGRTDVLAALNEKVDAGSYIRSGVVNYASFASCKQVKTKLLTHKGVEPRRANVVPLQLRKGLYDFKVLADLSELLLVGGRQMYPLLYQFDKQGVEVLQTEYVGRSASYNHYTDVLSIGVRKHVKGRVEMTLPQQELPEWVERCSDDVGDDRKTTCGLKYVLSGVKEGFKEAERPVISFEIKN